MKLNSEQCKEVASIWHCPEITRIDIKRTLSNGTGPYNDASSGKGTKDVGLG
jgi:hypothetical protein